MAKKTTLIVIATDHAVIDTDLLIMPPEAFGMYMRLLFWAQRYEKGMPNERAFLLRLSGSVTKEEIERFDGYWEEYIFPMFRTDDEGRLIPKTSDFLVGSKPFRDYIPLDIRRKVLSVGFCNYCGALDNLVVDHIRPVKHGGTNHLRNLQCLCWFCNSRKRDKWSGNLRTQTKEFCLG